MTTSSDRIDGLGDTAHKSRRRRPSITAQAVAGSDLPVVAPSPPPIEQLDDEEAASAVGKPTANSGDVGRSRSRSSSSTRTVKRETGSSIRSKRATAASVISAAKNARVGLLDGRDSLAASNYASNNNEDEGDDCFQDEGRDGDGEGRDSRRRRSRSRSRRSSAATGPELFSREAEVTKQSKSDRRGSRPALPSRSRRYRQQSAGPDKSGIAQQHADRPPSRQRHAFPTHLIDANAFCAPTPSVAVGLDSDDGVTVSSQLGMSTSAKNERPPSRYMTKSNRRAQGSAASHRSIAVEASSPQTEVSSSDPDAEGDSSGRCVPSRRLAVEFGSFSCNQAHHDPKTDGFADVDESIPPPFRIEITTESSAPPSPSSASSTSTPPSSLHGLGFVGKAGGRPPRRTASFSSNQQQLGQTAKRPGDGRTPQPHHSLKTSFNPLQWFGDDDQINDPDNFETVITVASPPPSDPGLNDDSEDPSTERDEDEVVDDSSHVPSQWPSMQPPPTALMPTKASGGGHSWMVRSLNNSSANNTRSLFKSDVPDFVSMDADTAIAETPLYDGSSDLMAIATQMSDLRLDDYSLADVLATTTSGCSGGNNAGVGGVGGAGGLGGSAPPLHTSLGRDFLSLFAQH